MPQPCLPGGEHVPVTCSVAGGASGNVNDNAERKTEPSAASAATDIALAASVSKTESTQHSALLMKPTSALLTTATGAPAVKASTKDTATDVPLIAGAAAAGAVVLLAVVGVAVAVGKRCRRQSAPNNEVPMASKDGAAPNESPAPQRTSEYGLMSAAHRVANTRRSALTVTTPSRPSTL